MATVHSFGASPISCHAWSSSRSELALSHNTKDVTLYSAGRGGGGWTKTAVLDQHDLRVTGIDWAPKTNRIVTCSSDRNAYVWVQGPDGQWKYTLVLLRINRAATCVSWSPDENKFAVGSGAKIISVCYYEKDNDWWVAKHIKKPLKSTVTCLDWHPNNILLAAGSTDFKVRVYSGFIKEIEPKPSSTPWGARMPMGNLMTEFSNSPNGGGWVHAVSFSGDGSKLAWVGHDSSISVADATNEMMVMKLRTDLLPLLTLTWLSDRTLVAAGHNCVPITFNLDTAGSLTLGARLEEDKKQEESGTMSARTIFGNRDKYGQSDLTTKLNTTHQNQISELRIHDGGKESVSTISTVAGDGKLVIWDIKSLSSKLANLKI